MYTMPRSFDLILWAMELQHKFLSRGLRRSDLCFTRTILTNAEDELEGIVK